MIIDKTALEQAIAHLIECARDGGAEGVGLLSAPLAGRVRHAVIDPGHRHGGSMLTNVTVERWTALLNVSDYPRLRYEVDPGELLAVYDDLEADGYRPVVIVHSHTRGGTAPSSTDIRYATNPALFHLIVDLAPPRPVPVLYHILPNEVDQVRRVRFQVADLRKQENPPTDLTRGVTGA